MNAIPPDFNTASAAFDEPVPMGLPVDLGLRWEALRKAASVIAAIAGPAAGASASAQLEFPVLLLATTGARKSIVEQAIGDLIAVMEAGLTAIAEVHARGGQTGPAALALWQEFVTARKGLLTLLPPVALASTRRD